MKTYICLTEEEVYRAAHPTQGPGDLHALGTRMLAHPVGGHQEGTRPAEKQAYLLGWGREREQKVPEHQLRVMGPQVSQGSPARPKWSRPGWR